MLIEFSVENFRSFKKKTTFSMVVGNNWDTEKDWMVAEDKFNLLKAAAIFGANGSGKSNLWKALSSMTNIIIHSSKVNNNVLPGNIMPFRLDDNSFNKATTFEVVFIGEDNVRYRYGFSATREKIVSEWLFYALKEAETLLFERKSTFKISKEFLEGEKESLKENTRENALFLTVLADLNGKTSSTILKWFKNNSLVINSAEHHTDKMVIDYLKNNQEFKDFLQSLLNVADLGITEAKVIEKTLNFDKASIPEKLRNLLPPVDQKWFQVITIRKRQGLKGDEAVIFDLVSEESEGSKKLFYMAPLLYRSLKEGKLLVMDEFETGLHPLLQEFILSLYKQPEINTGNGQLIFFTHSSFLMESLRRDQVWFTEKDKDQSSNLYALSEFEKGGKKVRKDEAFERNYLKGAYGAIPYLRKWEIMKDGEGEEV